MISIVIPLYNKAQSIESTIRCIQAQTYQDFEIVVVEGWSKEELQQQTGLGATYIRVLLSRARKTIRQLFKN